MSLILLIHITLAISSVLLSTFLFFNPSKNKINGVFVLFGGALLTGTALILINSAHLIQSCLTGIIYTAVVLGLVTLARRKLAKQNLPQNEN